MYARGDRPHFHCGHRRHSLTSQSFFKRICIKYHLRHLQFVISYFFLYVFCLLCQDPGDKRHQVWCESVEFIVWFVLLGGIDIKQVAVIDHASIDLISADLLGHV